MSHFKTGTPEGEPLLNSTMLNMKDDTSTDRGREMNDLIEDAEKMAHALENYTTITDAQAAQTIRALVERLKLQSAVVEIALNDYKYFGVEPKMAKALDAYKLSKLNNLDNASE